MHNILARTNETDDFTQYFDKQRGFAMGVLTTGNSVGGMIYPVVVRQLMPKVSISLLIVPSMELQGWQTNYR